VEDCTRQLTTRIPPLCICLLLIGLYILYKSYTYLKGKVNCVKSLIDANASGNVVNLKIHTSNESLAMAQEDVPLRELNSRTPRCKTTQIE